MSPACSLSRPAHDKGLPAAQAVYDWWQYRLCDVFIELVKPVMQQGSSSSSSSAHQNGGTSNGAADPAAEQLAFRHTLWTCLDTGLRCVPGQSGLKNLCCACDWLVLVHVLLAIWVECLAGPLANGVAMLQH